MTVLAKIREWFAKHAAIDKNKYGGVSVLEPILTHAGLPKQGRSTHGRPVNKTHVLDSVLFSKTHTHTVQHIFLRGRTPRTCTASARVSTPRSIAARPSTPNLISLAKPRTAPRRAAATAPILYKLLDNIMVIGDWRNEQRLDKNECC